MPDKSAKGFALLLGAPDKVHGPSMDSEIHDDEHTRMAKSAVKDLLHAIRNNDVDMTYQSLCDFFEIELQKEDDYQDDSKDQEYSEDDGEY